MELVIGGVAAAPAPADLGDDERIGALLDEIAASRVRLDDLLLLIKDERERMQSSLRRLKETWDRIGREEPFQFLTPRRSSAQMGGGLTNLTSREIEVLRLIALGLSTQQIAERLEIRFKTAACHRSHVLEKTKCHESVSLVRLAIHAGLVA